MSAPKVYYVKAVLPANAPSPVLSEVWKEEAMDEADTRSCAEMCTEECPFGYKCAAKKNRRGDMRRLAKNSRFYFLIILLSLIIHVC